MARFLFSGITRHDAWRWGSVGLLSVVVLLLPALPSSGNLVLRYERSALADGELWRIWTAHLVHLGWRHAGLNIVGLWLCAALAPLRWSACGLWLRWGVLASGVSVLLWLASPRVSHYVGMSGVLYGLALWALWRRWRDGDRVAGLIALAVVVWAVIQLGWGASPSEEAWLGGQIVTQAHVYGLVCAAVAIAAGRAARFWRVPRDSGPQVMRAPKE